MVRATDIKYKPTGPLAGMIGGKSRTRGQIVKALWKLSKRKDFKAKAEQGKKSKYHLERWSLSVE